MMQSYQQPNTNKRRIVYQNVGASVIFRVSFQRHVCLDYDFSLNALEQLVDEEDANEVGEEIYP